MTCRHFAEGQVLFREGEPADCVFRLLRGAVDIFRELDGDPILLGTVGAGQFIGEMGVVENRPRSATARAASEVEVEILTPTEFLDQIAGSPRAARELIQRLSQRLREADDRIVDNERRSGRAQGTRKDPYSQTAVGSGSNAYLAAKNPWLQRQFHTPLGLGDLPFVVGRGPVAREGLPPLQPDLKLDDTVPFRLSLRGRDFDARETIAVERLQALPASTAAARCPAGGRAGGMGRPIIWVLGSK
jgi:CRP/FNR family transcriptional regulator, cyclic AMP receptor protein